MTETIDLSQPELGLNAHRLSVDPKTNIVDKVVFNPVEHNRRVRSKDHDLFAFLKIVHVIGFISNPRWGVEFRNILPDFIEAKVVENHYITSGYEVHIKTNFIKGQPLSSMSSLPQHQAHQLAIFLEGSARMVRSSREEQGILWLPDLLGGGIKPHDRFNNFIIEDDTQKLKFVDLYPVVELPAGFDFRRYRKNYTHYLTKAAEHVNNPEVNDAARELVQTILKR